MKQYTSKDQTAKLIELGFPEPLPKYIHIGGVSYDSNHNYSIGELIEFLSPTINFNGLVMVSNSVVWIVQHGLEDCLLYGEAPELIDALYEYCVILKQEELI